MGYRMSFFRFVFIAAIATVLAPLALPADPVLPEEQIVVTAVRAPVPLQEVLVPVLVIDRDAIERSGAGDPGDILRFHAGLELGRNGGPGQTTAVFMRGADSNHTLVLVDGVRINPGTIGVAALQSIDTANIERIEVVKGPRSALYGTDAIGGVINVITRRGTDSGWAAEVGYGDYDTTEASLSGGFTFGRTELDFGAAWTDSQGFPTRTTDDVDRGFHNLNTTAQLRTSVGAADVSLSYWRADGTTEYSDFLLAPVDQDFANSTTTIAVDFPLGTALRGSVTASHFDDRIEQNQTPDYLTTDRDSLGAQFDYDLSALQSLSAGGMAIREKADSLSYGESMKADTSYANLFVQDRLSSGPHRALLAVGYTTHETAGDYVTWNAEYGYTLREATLLYGLAGTGFRAPDATDLYGYGGNADLDPERSFNIEAGVRHRFDGGHALSFSAFRNQIDDLIEFVVLSYDPFAGQNRNVDRARIEGIEAAYEYSSGPWSARVEAIYQDPENLTTGEQLFRRARQSLTVAVARSLGPVELGLDVLATGERKDFGFPKPVTLDSYVLANVTARWKITRALSLVARLENALNEQYELASTFNTPDRGLYVSMRYAPGTGAPTAVAAAPPEAPVATARDAYSASLRPAQVSR
jgi:vitamin B12 transporter